MKSSREQRREFVSELVHYDSLRLQAKMDAEEKALQAEVNATPGEWRHAVYEEGQKQGDQDAAHGIEKHYLAAVEALKLHPQQPYWQGYVEGYEDHEKENRSITTAKTQYSPRSGSGT
jgi:hypothetical protein